MKEYKLKCYPGDHPRIPVTEEFVHFNNFILNKTSEEIKTRFNAERAKFMGFQAEVLMDYLPWEMTKEFYKDEFVAKVEAGEAEKPEQITDVNEAVQDMLDYLIFGYMKAMDERGISASRTVEKLAAWFWLLGREDLSEIVNREDNYNPYGMPALIEVTEKMGLPVPEDCRAFAEKKVS